MNTNLGDDLFVEIICKRYADVQFQIYCTADKWAEMKPAPNLTNVHFWKAEAAVQRLFKGGALGRFLKKCIFYLSAKRVARLRKRCCAVVKIGGSVFMEKGMLGATPLPLTETEPISAELFENAKREPPHFLIGANVGPVYTRDYLHTVARELTAYTSVVFRDKASYRLYRSFPNVRYAPDVIFQYPVGDYQIAQTEKQIFLSPISLENRNFDEKDMQGYYGKMAEICRYYIETGYEMVLASFCKREGDLTAIERIRGQLSEDHRRHTRVLSYEGDTGSVLTEMGKSEFLICCRFHSVVLSLLLGKSIYPISYGDKTTNLLSDLSYAGHWTTVDMWKDTPVEDVEHNRQQQTVTDVEHFKCASQKQFEPLDAFIEALRR